MKSPDVSGKRTFGLRFQGGGLAGHGKIIPLRHVLHDGLHENLDEPIHRIRSTHFRLAVALPVQPSLVHLIRVPLAKLSGQVLQALRFEGRRAVLQLQDLLGQALADLGPEPAPGMRLPTISEQFGLVDATSWRTFRHAIRRAAEPPTNEKLRELQRTLATTEGALMRLNAYARFWGISEHVR